MASIKKNIKNKSVRVSEEIYNEVIKYCETSIPKVSISAFYDWSANELLNKVNHKPTPRGL